MSESFEAKARRYLEEFGQDHFLKGSSGLFEPSSKRVTEPSPAISTAESSQTTIGRDSNKPFHVSVLHDWLVISISFATMLLLVATVIYTRRQWLQANRSANASEIAANAARTSSDAATNAFNLNRESLRATGAGVIFPNLGFEVGSGIANVTFENRGKGNAWDLKATYRLSTIALPSLATMRAFGTKTASHPVIIPLAGRPHRAWKEWLRLNHERNLGRARLEKPS